jgi:hypothetical protein
MPGENAEAASLRISRACWFFCAVEGVRCSRKEAERVNELVTETERSDGGALLRTVFPVLQKREEAVKGTSRRARGSETTVAAV